MTRADGCATCIHDWHGLACQGTAKLTSWPNLTCPCPGPYAQPAPEEERHE